MNKVWFVTGAGRGLGAAIARAALADGDCVVVSGRRLAHLQGMFAEYGDRVLAVPLDVSNQAQALAAVEQAVARFGRIDVLVNNAGYGQLAPSRTTCRAMPKTVRHQCVRCVQRVPRRAAGDAHTT